MNIISRKVGRMWETNLILIENTCHGKMIPN